MSAPEPSTNREVVASTPPRPTLRRRSIYLLPNAFTTAALFGGFYAIVMAMNHQFDQATVAIFVAMVLDSLDGRVARMTRPSSAIDTDGNAKRMGQRPRVTRPASVSRPP